MSRVVTACCLGIAFATAACDKPEGGNGQAPAASPPRGQGSAQAGAVDRSHKGEAAPDAAFTAPDGSAATLTSFRGTPLLVNLWATWCAPCVKEMPTLNAAATSLAGRVRVIAVSQDMDGRSKVDPFFAARKFAALQPYTDPKLALSLAYGANLPTTILYGADGRELWRVTGDLDWTGAKAKALLAEAS